MSCFEGKYIASVLDLLPLEEGAALVPKCIRRPNRWKWRYRGKVQETHPVDYVAPAGEQECTIIFT